MEKDIFLFFWCLTFTAKGGSLPRRRGEVGKIKRQEIKKSGNFLPVYSVISY
jgi:hypothetical protein